MNVAELIERLSDVDPAAEVRIETVVRGDQDVLRLDDVADEDGRVTTVWLIGSPA
jgi:hypothetical protein